ncbi:hypothetical protein [Microbacterium rhizomatis]|uniref:Uncharacterized protein n=1 Tax=Microbacterium rhizomatis TaxID=1631477 RepID=A0A5J5J5B5_9MICO|nr:hypothetical protein [Microbacterium rhizomatis]KAA9110175.1 hypothetical protein F6B43_00245 [Microbacterium rhizomatis]
MTERRKPLEVVAAAFVAVVAFLAAEWQDVLEVVGMLLIVVGIGLWSLSAGLIAAGLALLLVVYPAIPRRWRR